MFLDKLTLSVRFYQKLTIVDLFCLKLLNFCLIITLHVRLKNDFYNIMKIKVKQKIENVNSKIWRKRV